jgi:hypothetical protein
MLNDLQSIAKRFWKKVDIRGADECWLWKGAINGGKGIITITTKPKQLRESAHRVAAKLAGVNVLAEDIVKHTCKVGICCNPRHLYIKVKPLDANQLMPYNAEQRRDSSLAFEADLARRYLLPLKFGKSVVMVMDDPSWVANPKYKGKKRHKLVVIAPGPMHGFSETCFLVSVVGGGACIVHLNGPHSVANLVLAGMPAALAKELMNQIHQVMKE